MAETDFGRYGHQGRGPDFGEGPWPAFSIWPTDRRFGPRAASEPGGPCSRCGEPIPEREVPLWAFGPRGAFAYRYHLRCVGTEPVDDEEPE